MKYIGLEKEETVGAGTFEKTERSSFNMLGTFHSNMNSNTQRTKYAKNSVKFQKVQQGGDNEMLDKLSDFSIEPNS
jgi:hypothetical protein